MKCKNLKLLNALCVVIFMLFGCAQPESEPPHVHTFSEAWTTDATSHWHAATCEHTTEVSGKADHQFPETWKLVTAATEEAAGLEERFCEVCNYRATQVIPQLNHNHDIATTWSTDSTKHWHAASCGREEHNEDVAEHTEDSGTVTKDATCGTQGVKTFKCSVCRAELRTEDIPATGLHTEDSGTVTTEPTCGTKGVKTFKCSVCDALLRTEELPATGLHTEDSGTVTTPATCTTAGVKTYKCTVCGKVLRTEAVPATGHTEDSGTVTTPVTLTTDGEKTYKCTVCKAILSTEDLPCPELYSTPIDATTGAPPTAESKYIYFGVFPRDVLPTTSTVTVDETVFVEMGANTYYLGSDGNYYAKCAENAFDTGDYYKYHDGTQPGRDGTTTRYFRVEPILWRVLTDNYSGKKLLLAKEILTANVPYYEDYDNNRSINGKTIYPNNYKHSQIRAYLNGLTYQAKSNEVTNWNNKGFLQTAFTQSAQALIEETDVDNSPETTGYSESTYATKYACENTTDKIFLLSESEVINSDYGFFAYDESNFARKRIPTDYAKANNAGHPAIAPSATIWWLRSPSCDNSWRACYVDGIGRANFDNEVDITSYGVVPALSISF